MGNLFRSAVSWSRRFPAFHTSERESILACLVLVSDTGSGVRSLPVSPHATSSSKRVILVGDQEFPDEFGDQVNNWYTKQAPVKPHPKSSIGPVRSTSLRFNDMRDTGFHPFKGKVSKHFGDSVWASILYAALVYLPVRCTMLWRATLLPLAQKCKRSMAN